MTTSACSSSATKRQPTNTPTVRTVDDSDSRRTSTAIPGREHHRAGVFDSGLCVVALAQGGGHVVGATYSRQPIQDDLPHVRLAEREPRVGGDRAYQRTGRMFSLMFTSLYTGGG